MNCSLQLHIRRKKKKWGPGSHQIHLTCNRNSSEKWPHGLSFCENAFNRFRPSSLPRVPAGHRNRHGPEPPTCTHRAQRGADTRGCIFCSTSYFSTQSITRSSGNIQQLGLSLSHCSFPPTCASEGHHRPFCQPEDRSATPKTQPCACKDFYLENKMYLSRSQFFIFLYLSTHTF